MAEDWLQGLYYIGNGDNGELLIAGFGSSIMSEVVVGSLADKPMGAGRDAQTFWFKKKKAEYQETSSFNSTFRNLRKNDLKAVIFGCNHTTIEEYYSQQFFELPDPHFTYVRNIDPGLPLLLFNYRNRRLYGVFEAASDGSMNISPYAWNEDEYEYTTLCPAQVKVKIRMRCQPLVEDDFGPVITENYYESGLFRFELDRVQTEKLISLFSSFPPTVSSAISLYMEKRSSTFNASSDGWESDDEHEDGGGLKENFS